MNRTIDIVIATDSNYLIHAATLIQSIHENVKGKIHIHIFAFNLNEKEKDFLSFIKDIEYHFYNMNIGTIRERLFSSCKLIGDRSFATYARLLIPELLPKEIKKCIYLDVDGIVLNDLGNLYENPIEGYAIAGVLDTNPIRRHFSVGLSQNEPYINAGMILWNLIYCRNNNIVNKFKEFITKKNGEVDAMDQGTLNGTLSDVTLIIPPKFNTLTSFYEMKVSDMAKIYKHTPYSQAQIDEAISDPYFIHFTPSMTTRPWIKRCKHPLKNLYWKYRLKVNNTYLLSPDKRPMKQKILSFLFYNMKPLYFCLLK